MNALIVATLLVAASAIREPIQANEVACSVTCVKESVGDKILVAHPPTNDHASHRCYHDGTNCVCFCQDPDCAEVAAAGDFGIIAAATHGETVSQNCNSGFTTDVVGSKTCTHGVFSGTDPTCTAVSSLMEAGTCPGVASSTAVQQGATAALSSTGFAYSCGIPGTCLAKPLNKPGHTTTNSANYADSGCYTSLALAKADCDITSDCYGVWNKNYAGNSWCGGCNCFQMRSNNPNQGAPGVNAPLTEMGKHGIANQCGNSNVGNWGYTYMKDNGGYNLAGRI